MRAYHAGSDREQQAMDKVAKEQMHKIMESVLRHVPRVRRLVEVFEHDLAFAASVMDDMGIRPGGAHGDKTQNRGVRMATDRTLNTMKRRLREIDAIFSVSLSPLMKHFTDKAFWGGRKSIDSVCGDMHIEPRTYYKYRQIVLDAFIDGLPDQGWIIELQWWGGLTLQDLEGQFV